MNSLRLCITLIVLALPAFSHGQTGNTPAPQGRIGMRTSTITAAQAQAAGLSAARGVVIVAVEKGGPAAQAGLEPGDIVLAVNDVAIENLAQLTELTMPQPGTAVGIAYWRNGAGQSASVVLGEAKPSLWPLGTGRITKKTAQGTWRNARVLGGKAADALNGPGVIEYVSFTRGWEGMRFLIAGQLILSMPSAATVRRFAVPCGPIHVKWAGSNGYLEQPVLGEGNCVDNAPDGEVVLYGRDGRSQVNVTYANGQPAGPMVFRSLRMDYNDTGIQHYVIATGTAGTVMRDGIAWLEFSHVKSYAQIDTSSTYLFVDGQTDHFLPTGHGKCSKQLHGFRPGPLRPGLNEPVITVSLDESVPCMYTQAFTRSDGFVFTNRRDAANDAEMAAYRANQAVKAEQRKEVEAAHAEIDRQRARERSNDTPSRPAAPYVPSAVAGMARLQHIQRDAERYGATLKAEQSRSNAPGHVAPSPATPSRTAPAAGAQPRPAPSAARNNALALTQRADSAPAQVAEAPRKSVAQADPNPYASDRNWRQIGVGNRATRETTCSEAKSRADADVAKSLATGNLRVLAVSPCVCYTNPDMGGDWSCRVYAREETVRKNGPADGVAR